MSLFRKSISIEDDAIRLPAISSLRESLSLKLFSECEEETPYFLFEKDSSIGICDRKEDTKFILDFRKKSFLRRIESELCARDPFLRAMGKDTRTVFDMTMGFAKDAVLLTCAGKEVWACEKNPIIFSIVKQALENISSLKDSKII